MKYLSIHHLLHIMGVVWPDRIDLKEGFLIMLAWIKLNFTFMLAIQIINCCIFFFTMFLLSLITRDSIWPGKKIHSIYLGENRWQMYIFIFFYLHDTLNAKNMTFSTSSNLTKSPKNSHQTNVSDVGVKESSQK